MSETSSNAIPAYLPLRNDLIGEEPYGAPQLDVPVMLNVNEESVWRRNRQWSKPSRSESRKSL